MPRLVPIALVGFALVASSCSATSASPSADAGVSPDLATYRIDLSQFPGGSLFVANSSILFPLDLGAPTKVITSEGRDRLTELYDRLSCEAPSITQAQNDDRAAQRYGSRTVEIPIVKNVVRLESIALELPDDINTGIPLGAVCFAYRTADGAWHGHLQPAVTAHDDAAHLSRVTLEVQADHVDVVVLVIYTGRVRSISFVARLQPL